MDGYPLGSLDHNVPYIVVSGLTATNPELPLPNNLKDEENIYLKSELPPLSTSNAKVLEEHLKLVDERGKSWAGVGRETPYRFRIRSVGRSIALPPRRAHLPETPDPLESHPVLHSPFSPLSPVSSLYPDGLINAHWIKKHQELVPSIILCFYTLTTDPTTTTLEDNKLKADIGELKAALAKSGYKTRLAIALLGDDDSTPATLSTGLQDRLENIRRGTALDPKSLFYIPPQESNTELQGVADSVLTTVFGSAIEYYRDLARHSRKKRSRGVAPPPTVPPTTGTSRTLSIPDWSFRYDFKSAVFAEFRQEYDAAIRFYEQAYGILLGQDVLDVIPSWSPRWNDARLISDVIAIRCLRLNFWMGTTSLAVRRWQVHRDRIADFVDRRGQGTRNYGWEAWEARWALVMSDLMDRLEPRGLREPTFAVYIAAEKVLANDRLNPWELLHHKGYWYRIAARHLARRRRLARTMPDEDRAPPDGKKGGKTYGYDTYLCPQPYDEYPLTGKGVNHAQLIIDCLIKARTQFQTRKQHRIAAEISLECAKEMASIDAWKDVLSMLRPLWEDLSFRSEGWLDISEDFCWLLRRAAVQEDRADLVVAIDWELMHRKFTPRPQWHYDLSKSLDEVECPTKPEIKLADDTVSTFIRPGWAFQRKGGKAGEICVAQLSLQSEAFPNATPVTLSSLRIEFEGALKPIIVEHTPSNERTDGSIHLSVLSLQEVSDPESEDLPTVLKGQTDLTLAPGKILVAEMAITLREAGEVASSTLQLAYETEAFSLEYTMKLGQPQRPTGWFLKGIEKPHFGRSDAHTLQVEPRPPKMEIRVLNSSNQFYANEPIELHIQLYNAEDETANVKVDIDVSGEVVPSLTLQAAGEEEEQTADGAKEKSSLTGFSAGDLGGSTSLDLVLKIDPAEEPTALDLEIRALYHLESDAATPILQILPLQLTIVNAFEANYDLVPRIHEKPWPSLFDYDTIPALSAVDGTSAPPLGLSQSWSLVCHYASFALHDIKVVGMDLKVLSHAPNAWCEVPEQPQVPENGIVIAPKTMHEARFDLVTQKKLMEDRQAVSLELGFVLRWQRLDGSDKDSTRPVNTTTMVAGNYLVLGSEPRVLASAYETDVGKLNRLLHLDITIENPSSHFLTFGLSMDPSDEFAFSGAKQNTVHLLPLSRRTLTYRLLPLARDTYIRPGISVRDKYFQKTLRIIPTEGMKIDKEGLLIWVPPLGEDEETEAQKEEE